MVTPITENPFAVLKLIAAPAVFTNAPPPLCWGQETGSRSVVDPTRSLTRELHDSSLDDAVKKLWVNHLVMETRLALRSIYEEVELAKRQYA